MIEIIQRIRKSCHLIKSGVALMAISGGVSEWPMEHAWKACKHESVSWVRIPLPPIFAPQKAEEASQRFGLREVILNGLFAAIPALQGRVKTNDLNWGERRR